jgi:hypothetical protein
LPEGLFDLAAAGLEGLKIDNGMRQASGVRDHIR